MAICPKCRTQHPDEVKVCPHDGEVLMSEGVLFSSDAELQSGQMVGEYKIEAKIGEGGFGTVYRAEQPLIGKRVAVKVLNREYSSNPQMVSRFVSEARAVNQIQHRNIIDIFSFGVLDDKRQYFVMEFLDGMPFDEYLVSRGRIPAEEVIPILRQVAKALDAAHASGIAHRDLKPENVFLAFDSDGVPYPKLLDFGIAKLLGESSRSGHKTRTGTPIGTPMYMSPEQCLGKGVDHRADIYSFGVMVHQVLTGVLPFDAEETMTLMFKQMNEPPPPMSSVCADLSPALDAPVLRMLAKDPAERPDTVSEAIEELAAAARNAGLNVTVAPITRPRPVAPLSVDTPGAQHPYTPAEQMAIASARTMPATPDPHAQTLSASSVSAGALPLTASRGRGLLYVAIAVGLLGVIGTAAAFVSMRGDASASSSMPAALSAPATSVSESVPHEAPVASDAPSSAPAAIAVAALVKLTVQSEPEGVEIFLGDGQLGAAPGPIAITRSDEPLTLTFKAPGYQPKTLDIVPKADSIVSVTLTRVSSSKTHRPPKPRNTGPSEIENPF